MSARCRLCNAAYGADHKPTCVYHGQVTSHFLSVELPPREADLDESRDDAREALSVLAIETERAYRRACGSCSRAELETFIERAKQLLNVVATAAAVLP